MTYEESISVEETNKIRILLGLKPIPLPSNNTSPPPPPSPSPPPAAHPSSSSGANNNSISLSETNKLRLSIGLKPIPEPSVIASIQQQTTEQYQQAKQAEEKNSVIKAKLELAKTKAANKRKKIVSRSILDDLEEEEGGKVGQGNDDWLNRIGMKPEETTTSTNSVKKSKRFNNREQDNHDLSGMKVSHNLLDLQDLNQETVVLTFKDQSIYEEVDELESELLVSKKRTEDQVKERLQTRGNGQFGMEKSRMETYEERLKENKDENQGFMLSEGGVIQVGAGSTKRNLESVEQDEDSNSKRKKIEFSFESEDELDNKELGNDYAKVKPIKMKKLKNKNKSRDSSNARRREISTGPMTKVQLQDEDYNITDDQFIQTRLSKQRRDAMFNRKKILKTPEELAKEIQEDLEEEAKEQKRNLKNRDFGLVYDENTEFLSSIKVQEAEDEAEEGERETLNVVTQANVSSQASRDKNAEGTNASRLSEQVPEPMEKDSSMDLTQSLDFSGGIASTLSFLKSKNVVKEKTPEQIKQEQINERHRKEMELHKINYDIDVRILKERLKSEFEKNGTGLSKLEKEQYLNIELDKLKDKHSITKKSNGTNTVYNPEIKLTYYDNKGRQISAKEAYKELSHTFHGTNKGKFSKEKLDKQKRKIEQDQEAKEREGRLL